MEYSRYNFWQVLVNAGEFHYCSPSCQRYEHASLFWGEAVGREGSDFCSFHMLESFFNGVHMKHDEVLPSPVAYKEYFSINILTLQHVAVNK